MENQQIPTNAYGGAPVNESTGFGNTTNMANAHTGGVPGQQQGTYDSSNTVPGQQPGTYDSGNTVPGQHPGTYTSNDTVTGQQSGAYTSSGTVPGHAVGTNAGASTGSKIKGVATQVHGAGEALRGNFNAAVDAVSGDKVGQAKNEQVIDKGLAELDRGHVKRGGL